jgi:signal transduction histidine kinase
MEPIRALLVEDDEDDYVLTRGLLTEIDPRRFSLEWLRSFEEAEERIPRGGFDVCLIDYRLGAGDGLELLRLAREQGCEAPLILLTGQGDEEIDLAAMRSGASDYLVKGQITPAVLDRSIRYAIQHRHMEAERVRHARAQEARVQAEEANRAKDRFIAMVSHELRNPLHAVLGWVTLLSSGKLDAAAQARAIEAIDRNARIQARLIDDLLDIGRIVAGNLRLDLQPVELAGIVEQSIETVQPSASAKGICIASQLDGRSPLLGDASRLQQAVSNLLLNAVKFTPDGGEVSVSLVEVEDRARLEVRDNGRGIPASLLPHIFEPFRQGDDRPAERSREGLGLGLAITRNLVELHGGSIHVESPGEGQGATFRIELPLARPE